MTPPVAAPPPGGGPGVAALMPLQFHRRLPVEAGGLRELLGDLIVESRREAGPAGVAAPGLAPGGGGEARAAPPAIDIVEEWPGRIETT